MIDRHSALRGLRKGLIINVETTARDPQRWRKRSSASCGFMGPGGVTGGHAGGITSHGMVVVKDQEVSSAGKCD